MDDLKARQDLYNGFGDTLAKGFELAVTPILFGGMGYLLDRFLGLTPLFTIVFTLLCLFGLGAKMYYGYVAAMDEQVRVSPWSARPWAPRAKAPAAGPDKR